MNEAIQKVEDCKEILNFLGNKKTKVIENDSINASYYLFITDTIYLSNNKNCISNRNKKIDKTLSKYIIMCHECIHSIQSKKMHLMNTVLSNLELILFIILTLVWLTKRHLIGLGYVYFSILLISIIIRVLLELDAIKRSLVLIKKIKGKGIIKDIKENQINEAITTIKKIIPLETFRIIFPRMLRGIVVLYTQL